MQGHKNEGVAMTSEVSHPTYGTPIALGVTCVMRLSAEPCL